MSSLNAVTKAIIETIGAAGFTVQLGGQGRPERGRGGERRDGRDAWGT